MNESIILTGLRANGEFTLGNYLGALLPIVSLQNQYYQTHRINMFVPDLHSFTTPVNHGDLYLQIIKSLKYYVAAGIRLDFENVYIYRQSYISAHSELTTILNNFVSYGELQRMTQFKEKSSDAKDHYVTAGLFDYPVLMAADILLYNALWVPLGDDQRQHLELARNLAIKLNNKFKQELFVVPNEWQKQQDFIGRNNGVRIMSLKNPEKKMSKSVLDPNGTILLNDKISLAVKKIMNSTTDSLGIINYDVKQQPGISNLLNILSLLINEPLDKTIENWQGKTNYFELKQAVASEVKVFLEGFQKRLSNIDETELMRKLEASEYLMRDVATQHLYKIQQVVGLRP